MSNFWKFVNTPVAATPEQAAYIADKIQSGKFTVKPSEPGERIYRNAGWCFDLAPLAGYKPYVIEYHYGEIRRVWAKNIKEVRDQYRLSRKDGVVRYKAQTQKKRVSA